MAASRRDVHSTWVARVLAVGSGAGESSSTRATEADGGAHGPARFSRSWFAAFLTTVRTHARKQAAVAAGVSAPRNVANPSRTLIQAF